MTQTVTLGTGSGFPFILGWQDTAGNVNQATYAVSGNNLQRSLTVNGVLSSQSTVASNINSNAAKTNCTYAAGVLTFKITSAVGTSSQTRNYQVKIRIDQPSSYLTITTPSALPSGYSATSYSQTMAAAGGATPYVWTITEGNLPTGLSLGNAGLISGTPNVGQLFSAYNFTVQVTDRTNLTAVKPLTIMMNPLTIATASLPDGKKNMDYGNKTPNSPVYLTATGGTTVYTWSITSGGLPPGLLLNSSGLISGTDSTTGAIIYSFTITVTDSLGQTASKNLSIYIAD
jgi:large repetitive protein